MQAMWERSVDPKASDRLGPGFHLVGRWSFERELQRAGQKLPAVVCEHGSPRFVASPVGTGVELDGQTFLNAGDVGRFGYFDSFTLAAWVRPSGPDAGTIVSRMIDADDGTGYSLSLKGGKLQVNLVQRWLDDAIRVETAECLEPSAGTMWPELRRESRSQGNPHLCRRPTANDPCPARRVESDLRRQGTVANWRRRRAVRPISRRLDEVSVYDHVLTPEEILILATPDPLLRSVPFRLKNGGRPIGQAAIVLSKRPRRPRSVTQWAACGRSRKRSNASPARFPP